MYESSLICDRTIAPDEDVVCDGLSEDLDFENVCDDLLCLAVNVGVDEGNIVVACNDIA
jgi:hypothetical protein